MYIWKEIYSKEVARAIMEAGKSKSGVGGGVETQESWWCQGSPQASAGEFPPTQGGWAVCSSQAFT